MSEAGSAAEKSRTAPHPDDPRKPDEVTDIRKPSWKLTAKGAAAEFTRDQCTDLAAALTYYAVLSLFPALLALISLLGVFGQGEQTVDTLLELMRSMGQDDVAGQLEEPIRSMVNSRGAGITLVIGIVVALWSASGYVGAFGRAMNRVYEVDEGRPIWKLRPANLLLTIILVIGAGLVIFGLAMSGSVAEAVGNVIGLGSTAVTVWNIAKWPVILLIVIGLIALLYWGTPNVRQPKIRWFSVGAAVALLVWVLASVGFGFYVATFSSYNNTYGSLAGVIIFLLWLWITNLALLFGAEIDAELERSRQLQAGIEAEESVQLPPRDTRQSEKADKKREQRVAEGRRLRESAEHHDDDRDASGTTRDADRDASGTTRDADRDDRRQ